MLNLVLLSVLFGSVAESAFALNPKSYFSCASFDQSVKLRETALGTIDLSLGTKLSASYAEGDDHRVLNFTNGETVVKEVATGKTVLSYKEVPLVKTDRGYEKKILLSQSKGLSGPVYLQCKTIAPANSKIQSVAKSTR